MSCGKVARRWKSVCSPSTVQAGRMARVAPCVFTLLRLTLTLYTRRVVGASNEMHAILPSPAPHPWPPTHVDCDACRDQCMARTSHAADSPTLRTSVSASESPPLGSPGPAPPPPHRPSLPPRPPPPVVELHAKRFTRPVRYGAYAAAAFIACVCLCCSAMIALDAQAHERLALNPPHGTDKPEQTPRPAPSRRSTKAGLSMHVAPAAALTDRSVTCACRRGSASPNATPTASPELSPRTLTEEGEEQHGALAPASVPTPALGHSPRQQVQYVQHVQQRKPSRKRERDATRPHHSSRGARRDARSDAEDDLTIVASTPLAKPYML